MITIKDIARLANVSIGTVDRVIHERGRVSKETKNRIKQIIRETEYTPNIQARNLALAKSYTLKVLTPRPDQDNGFWAGPVEGVDLARKELEVFQVNIENVFFDRYSEDDFLQKAEITLDDRPDGIIIAPVLPEACEKFCRSIPESIKFALFDAPLPNIKPLCFIGQDAYSSGRLCAHLLNYIGKKGKNIAIVQITPADMHIRQRVEGFCSFFAKDDQPKIFYISNQDSEEENSRLLDKILNDPAGANALFISNASVYNLAEQISARRLPIRIIGYDLTEKNRHLLEQGKIDFLVSQSPDRQAYLCVRQLYRRLALKEEVEKQIFMPIDILTRENLRFY